MYVCVKRFHIVNIDVPADVGAPQLNTTSHHSNIHLKQPPEVLELEHKSYIGGSLLFGLSAMHKQHTADLFLS